MNSKKTFVFDLDNTLCDTKKKDDGKWDYLSALPFPKRIKTVNNLYDEGHEIIIETARGCVSGKDWYPQTFEQLVSFGLKFHKLRAGTKFNADFFVDDKAINDKDFFED